jgi:hypothetical protein
MSSSLALCRPLLLEDGRSLRTLADVGDLILHLTPEEQAQPRWQALVQALIEAIKSQQDDRLSSITDQTERTLREPPFGSVRLAPGLAAVVSEERTSEERASSIGVIAGSELLSIVAVGLTAGVIALGLL